MTNRKIKTATEVVTEFLEEQENDQSLDPETVKTVGKLRDEGKLTKTNLLRQLEILRKTAINTPENEGGTDD